MIYEKAFLHFITDFFTYHPAKYAIMSLYYGGNEGKA